MTASIRHRGPDDEGSFRDESAGVALGHRRLSIIDLSTASHQPMADPASGVVLAYNGELYNFQALRRELQALGHSFHSSGDTEVVLRSYLQWGIDALDRFAGMFALALWDPRGATLHLARDATGMKPLYICPTAHGVAFASEVKAFLQLPGFVARIAPGSLQQYLEFGYVFAEHATMLQGVQKLAPGERIALRGARVAQRAIWFTPPSPRDVIASAARDDRQEEASRLAELSATMGQVVGEHLIADVPVGMLLSGGLDSSVIAALAAQRGPVNTVCMGFGASDVDERAHARQVAEHIGARHHDVLISANDVQQAIQEGAWVFDDLFADWGTITSQMLYRHCRERGLKVVLVGEGADELFGGYDTFQLPPRLGLWQQFRLYQRYAGRRHGRLFGEFRGILNEYLAASGGDPFHAVRLFESRRQLPNNYVMKVDKASMAESVEARAPFLDRRVAELAWRTPGAWLQRGGENKYLLRALARQHGLLPDDISRRKKFGAPLAASWMADDPAFRRFARDLILAPGSQTEQAGLAPAMQAYFERGLPGFGFPRALSLFRNLAWRLLLLELWSKQYLAAVPTSTPAQGVALVAGEAPTGGQPGMAPRLVSTIIPVYNRPVRLREAVASVLAQDYRPIEIIIVDDGSTDGATLPAAQELAAAHPGVIRAVTQLNAGPGAARERGRLLAQGEFIQYLDSDDLLLPGKFNTHVAGLRANPQAGIAYGLTLERHERTGFSQPTHGTDVPHRKLLPVILADRIWHTITPLYRRSVTDAIGPWSPRRILEDWDYDFRAGLLGVELHYSPEPAAVHRFHGDDHAGLAWQWDPRAMRDRVQAYLDAVAYARKAGVSAESPEMQHLTRSVFWMCRETGARGYAHEARALFSAARQAAVRGSGLARSLRVYGVLARCVGWQAAGKASAWVDRARGSLQSRGDEGS